MGGEFGTGDALVRTWSPGERAQTLRRLLGPRERAILWVLFPTAPAVVLAGLLGLLVHRFPLVLLHPVLTLALLLIPYFFVFRRASELCEGAIERWLGQVARGDLARAARSVGAASDGLLHLRGKVRALEPVRTPTTDRPAVLWQVEACCHNGEVQGGVDFLLVPDDGSEPALIHPDRALILERPATALSADDFRRWIQRQAPDLSPLELPHHIHEHLRETVIGPGDHIDVIGLEDREVDPSAATRLLRQPPMRRALRGTTELPLLVRAVR